MSKEGILSILSKKIGRSDPTLRHSTFGFLEFFSSKLTAPAAGLTPDTYYKLKEFILDKDIVAKTQKTANLYFKDVKGERPFDLWRSFDKDLAKDLSLFITGKMYAREKIPHKTRQLITVSALTVLARQDELRLHIQAALNVGCRPEEIAEVIFQTAVYGGVPATNSALKTLKSVLEEKGLWPLD
jgi:4-carboxymuconolactone decarboxylase